MVLRVFWQAKLGIIWAETACICLQASVLFKVNFKSRGISMKELTISEVAQRAGIRASAIRYYESVQLLPTPRRVSGQRRYDEDVLRRLAVIQLAQRVGFTVAEIRSFFESMQTNTPTPSQWQQLAQQKLAEVESLMQRAAEMKQLLLQ